MIVPGGGFSLDGSRWISCSPHFLLPVQVLSRLFRRLCLQQLAAAHDAGRLQFFTVHAALADTKAFAAYLAPLRDTEWVVYAKEPFGGPEQVLRYMARYTHRVAIANSRLIAIDHEGVSFKWKDYRVDGPERIKVMTLAPEEFIRRFLIHVLPAGFHRIRHYGLLASSQRRQNIARARQLLNVPAPQPHPAAAENVPPADATSVPVLQRTHVRHRSFRARSYPPIPRNGASPGHADRHLMISVLQPPARKTCRLFRWFSTDHGEAQTSNTPACRVDASMPQISAKHRPLHSPSYSSYASPPSQTAQLAARHIPVSPARAFKSP